MYNNSQYTRYFPPRLRYRCESLQIFKMSQLGCKSINLTDTATNMGHTSLTDQHLTFKRPDKKSLLYIFRMRGNGPRICGRRLDRGFSVSPSMTFVRHCIHFPLFMSRPQLKEGRKKLFPFTLSDCNFQ